jgi:hypothetical protein
MPEDRELALPANLTPVLLTALTGTERSGQFSTGRILRTEMGRVARLVEIG